MTNIERREVTQQVLIDRFKYDPETGYFFRTKSLSHNARMNSPIGKPNKYGYLTINIFGKTFALHRLVWLYVHGCWPSMAIDHVNGIPNDNRLKNLRECTVAQNNYNKKKTKSNKSGFKGVTWNKKISKWTSRISINRKEKILGYFDDPKEAHAAYCVEAENIFGNFARFE